MLGQLHLESALAGAGAPGKDVQDKSGAVDDLDAQGIFQVALLAGGELIVGDEHIIIGGIFEG